MCLAMAGGAKRTEFKKVIRFEAVCSILKLPGIKVKVIFFMTVVVGPTRIYASPTFRRLGQTAELNVRAE